MLQELTNKIKKIIPEKDASYMGEEFEFRFNLEDILRCLEERVDWVKTGFLSIDTRGNFYSSKPDCEDKLDIKWQLGKPLHEQSEDVIKELNNLI